MQERFDDTKRVISSSKSTDIIMAKRKRTNNDLQNTTHKKQW